MGPVADAELVRNFAACEDDAVPKIIVLFMTAPCCRPWPAAGILRIYIISAKTVSNLRAAGAPG
jgi:hypothetical protein